MHSVDIFLTSTWSKGLTKRHQVFLCGLMKKVSFLTVANLWQPDWHSPLFHSLPLSLLTFTPISLKKGPHKPIGTA